MKKSFWKKLNNLCDGDESFTPLETKHLKMSVSVPLAKRSLTGFTLVELLVVIGILAVLTAAVILIINPVEYLRQARDVTRMSDLDSINKALSVLETQGITSFGTANTVYISIADNASSTCGSLGLSALPSGWSYHCVSSTNLQKTDGNGWIPVNFTQSTALAFSNLPLDPVNATSTTGNYYYTYVTGGSWEMTSELESSKYQSNAINDGDAFPGVYSIRSSNLSLTPGIRDKGLVGYWTFEEGSGSSVPDRSGNSNTGTWNGTGTHYTSGRVGSYAGQFSGANSDFVNVPDSSSLNIAQSFSITAWVNFSAGGEIFAKTYSYWANPFEAQYSGCDGKIYFLTGHGPEGYDINEAAYSLPCAWKFIALIFDGTNVSGYVDGVLTLAPTLTTKTVQNSANPFRMGTRSSTDNFISGAEDDVRIYNRALSVAEIQAIYNATK